MEMFMPEEIAGRTAQADPPVVKNESARRKTAIALRRCPFSRAFLTDTALTGVQTRGFCRTSRVMNGTQWDRSDVFL
jgi:hypothetical protein